MRSVRDAGLIRLFALGGGLGGVFGAIFAASLVLADAYGLATWMERSVGLKCGWMLLTVILVPAFAALSIATALMALPPEASRRGRRVGRLAHGTGAPSQRHRL